MRRESHSLVTRPKRVGDIAHDLRIYASGIVDGAVAAKLFAAAAELDAREASRPRVDAEE